MLAMAVISFINVWLILMPARPMTLVLELMNLPFTARLTLLTSVAINISLSVLFERWGTEAIVELITLVSDCWRNKRRVRDGKAYKAVDNGSR